VAVDEKKEAVSTEMKTATVQVRRVPATVRINGAVFPADLARAGIVGILQKGAALMVWVKG
jgi:hypothetical protein